MHFEPFPGESAQAAAIRVQVMYQQNQAFAALAAQDAARRHQTAGSERQQSEADVGYSNGVILLLLS
jgi:hypothetical protein